MAKHRLDDFQYQRFPAFITPWVECLGEYFEGTLTFVRRPLEEYENCDEYFVGRGRYGN